MAKKSLKLPVLDLSGKKKKEIILPERVFGLSASPQLIAQAVRVFLTNQRKAFPKAKTRSEIRGSRKKIWRQKGTGRARHGDQYAPIFVGGGVAHGPKGNQNFRIKLTKKMKRKALCGAISNKLAAKQILVVSGLKDIKPKTKLAAKVLTSGLKIGNRKCLIITPEKWKNTLRGFRNIPSVKLSSFDLLNTYLILNHEYLIFAQETIEKIAKEAEK